MKTVILTEGGREIGFGHITRCLALRDALAEKGISTTLAVNGDASIKKQFGAQIDQVFNWLVEKTRLARLLRRANIVIVDSYRAPLNFYNQVEKVIPVPIFLDDYVRLPYPRGVVVNGAVEAEKLHYAKKPGGSYLLGPQYALLRKDFWEASKKKIRCEIKDVLITFGGMVRKEFVRKLLAYLLPRFPKWHFHVVTASPIRAQTSQDSRTCFYSGLNAKKMRELMLKCDVAISGGGQTIHELSVCELPTVGICFAENQQLNILGWRRQGFLHNVGFFNASGIFKKVESSLGQLSFNQRCLMGKRGRMLVDGQGARRVAGRITDMLFDFRNMNTKDCRQVFDWSNDPVARSVSFCPEPIRWSEHRAWFRKKLKDPRCILYKVLWIGRPIGQIRFERVGDAAKISVSLASPYRRKGLGVPVIRLASQKLFRDAGVRIIKAFIKSDNASSRKAFQRAGFIDCGTTMMHGQKTNCWVLRDKKDE